MHSHRVPHGRLSRWLAGGAAVFAVAIPAAASVSASSPPTEPAGSEASGDTTAGGSAASPDCSTVFPLDAGPADDTATAETMATPDTMATPETMAVSETMATPETMAAPDTMTVSETMAAPDTMAVSETMAAPDSAAAEGTIGAAGSTAPAANFIPGPIQTAETALGTILVDGNCRALYVFTADVDGESTCFDACATAWPPALVENGEVPELAADLDPSLFSVVDHPLGPILKVGDFPLYYFASDTAPGDLNGQGVNGAWWVVAPDGTGIGMDAAVAATMPVDTQAAATVDSEPMTTDSGY